MAAIGHRTIWDNHTYPRSPCDTVQFPNQCAIRMGLALERSGINLRSFRGVRCWMGHNPRHILRAQELANWIAAQPAIFGPVKKFANVSRADFDGRTGLVFIQNGWGPTDHIDVWDGEDLKGGSPDYFALGEMVWFWEL